MKVIFKKHLFVSIFLLFCGIKINAVPATPYPVTRILPDGTELTVLLRGDEFFNYELTTDGYLIRENEKGFYEYARLLDNGGIVPTGMRAQPQEKRTPAEQMLLRTLQTFPDMMPLKVQSRVARAAEQEQSGFSIGTFPTTGSPKSIVILVNFSDVSFVTPNPNAAFTNLLNEPGYSANGGTGSARDYFKTASFEVSSPEFVVVGPYTLPHPRSFYGENDSQGNDKNPRQMIIDACTAAFNDGVDFSVYDTDGDGIVDNVFVFYAGHNEAEGGPKESVWPHRWALNTVVRFNGKYISGYACTSELRGSSGSNMCGIGTFAHEFGHVYGLPDYYPTNGATHHTLSVWNIMDAGAYLNAGRTPPTYSAYDRFFIGWITPTILKSPIDVELTDLQTTNKAYIITESGNHNLNGRNPNPIEFFTLENRQRTGWDSFLPNSGMLITRIVYNETTWRNNTPNNNAALMGVDIIEADEMAGSGSLSGDPFPGARNVRSYNPTTRAGVNMNRPLTEITESNGLITFKFMGGGNRPKLLSDSKQLTRFSTILGTPSVTREFGVSGSKMKNVAVIDFNDGQHFELRLANDITGDWKKALTLPLNGDALDSVRIHIRYNPTDASHSEIHFDYLNIKSEDAEIIQVIISGTSTRPVYVVPPVAITPSEIGLQGFNAEWNSVYDATGYYLSAWRFEQGTSSLKEGFNNGLIAPPGWTIKAESVNNLANFAGDSVPSIQLRNTNDHIITDEYPFVATGLRFFIRSIGELNGKILVEGWNGSDYEKTDEFNVSNTLNTIKSYTFNKNKNFRRFKISFTPGNASVAIDDVEVIFPDAVEFNTYNQWVTNTSAYIDLLLPGLDYYYAVRASDRTLNLNKTLKYENISGYSNIVKLNVNQTVWKANSKNQQISLFIDPAGFAVLKLDEIPQDKTIRVYLTDGRLYKTMVVNDTQIPLNDFSRGRVYIFKSGNSAIRVVL